MLRFPKKPDSVFLAILYAALEIRRDMVRELAEHGDPAMWRDDSPRLARLFNPQTVVSVLDRLLDALRDSQVYETNDYHWLVIYDCLEMYCDLVNDEARMSPDHQYPVGPYRLGMIDFDLLIEWFFWDIDFLFGGEIVDIGGREREERTISSESYSIGAGLAPHQSELEMKPLEAAPDWDEAETVPASGVISRYPPESQE